MQVKEDTMIKNIVFDMGNVLTEYEPDLVCAHFIKNDAMKRRINQTVFISPEWVLLDMGVISEEAALKRILSRLDSEEERDLAALCFEQWHLYNMQRLRPLRVLQCLPAASSVQRPGDPRGTAL